MKILNVLILIFLSLGLAHGQDNQTLSLDLVILKNGDEFEGAIIDYVYDSYVVIQTASNATWRFESADIKQVKKGSMLKIFEADKPFVLDKNYYSIGLGTIISSEKNYGLRANVAAVRQFNRWLGIGGGLSYTDYTEYYYTIERIATYVSLRTYYRDDATSPYTEFNLGYGFEIGAHEEFETVLNDGYYLNPKFGLRFGSTDVMWTIHVGASIQHAESDLIENEWSSWQEDRLLKRTELGFGLIF